MKARIRCSVMPLNVLDLIAFKTKEVSHVGLQ
jgi:hypothetical protein